MATGSDTLNLSLPTSWAELSDKQLRYVYFLLAGEYTAAEIHALCLTRWGALAVKGSNAEAGTIEVQHHGKRYTLLLSQIADAAATLSWLDSFPAVPVRLSAIAGHQALPADFAGVTLETLLSCDNYYQGFLLTRKEDLLDELARLLYDAPNLAPDPAERVSVFYWFTALKAHLARLFPHFLQAAGSDTLGSALSPRRVQEAMNAQIRALTKGDITKEQQVLAMDCYRALTELDAQAKEYQELKAKFPTK